MIRYALRPAATLEAPPPGHLRIFADETGAFKVMDAARNVTMLGGGSVSWGAISGTLADQADLQAAIDAAGALPAYTGNSGRVLAVNGTEDGVEWIAAAGAGTVTSVNAAGGTTGLSFTGGPITASGTLTLGGTLALAHGGTGATTAAGARSALGLAIGSDVQAYSANLASFATVAPTAAGLALLDDADAAAQRVTLGLGTAALAASGDFATAGHNHAGTYQPLDADLTAIAALATTAFGRGLLTEVDAASIRGTIGAGTVSSVGLSLPAIFSVSGSPVTGSGTLSATLASQSAALVFASPVGAAGAPGFRALVAGDIPVLNQNTTGSAASLTTGRTIGMTGDVVWTSPAFNGTANVSAAGTIQAGAVSLAKMADVATGTLFYRKTAGSGPPEVQTLATLKTDLGLTGTNSGDQTITLTGDVTGGGTGSFAAAIANDAVSNLKLANMATATFKGRVTAGTGDPEDLTGTQATTLLDVFTTSLKGLAPASGGGTTNFLRADGTWAAPPGGGGVSDGDKGDITVSASGATWTIDAGVVSLTKMANMATASVIYRKTAGSGAPEVQTLATLKTDLGLTGTNSGDQTITLTGDVTGSGAGSFAATIANGAVSLAKMANMATASVIYRKTAGSGAPEVQTLATLKTDLGLTGTNSGDQTITLTGDVTGSGAGSFAATIANDAVSNLKLANMATATFKGRATAGTGDPEDLTGTQATTLLDVFTSGLKGLAPASGGGTTNFLRADGSWAAPAGGGGGGWTQIGSTLTPTGVSSVEFNDIPASYSELVLVCEGLSHNFGSNTALRVNFSDNGTNWTADYTWGTAASAAVAWYGGLHIPHYTAPAGMAAGTVSDLSSNNSLGTSSGVPAWRCAGGITDIRVKVNGGTFDAGTLKLYGRA